MDLPILAQRFHRAQATPFRTLLLGFALCLWISAIGAGFGLLFSYKNLSGEVGSPPVQFPSNNSLLRSSARHTLLVFSHPHCPCTRATFRELDRIVSQGKDSVDVHIIFVATNGVAGSAETTRLSSAASDLGFAKIYYDNGELGKRFAVKTSGHVLLYDMNGNLQFSGGVTASRGHEGPSIGGSAIATILAGRQSNTVSTAIYGCPLFSQTSNCDEKPCIATRKGA